MQVGQSVEELVGDEHHVEVGQVDAELRDRLSAGVEHIEPHAGDIKCRVPGEDIGRADVTRLSAEDAQRGGATVVMHLLRREQVGAVVADAHHLPRQDLAELACHLRFEVGPRVDPDVTVGDRLARHERRRAVVVVGVMVRVEDGPDRFVGDRADLGRDVLAASTHTLVS